MIQGDTKRHKKGGQKMAHTTQETMKALKISRSTFMRWMKAGKFRGARKHRAGKTATWLIPDDTIAEIKRTEVLNEITN